MTEDKKQELQSTAIILANVVFPVPGVPVTRILGNLVINNNRQERK